MVWPLLVKQLNGGQSVICLGMVPCAMHFQKAVLAQCQHDRRGLVCLHVYPSRGIYLSMALCAPFFRKVSVKFVSKAWVMKAGDMQSVDAFCLVPCRLAALDHPM